MDIVNRLKAKRIKELWRVGRIVIGFIAIPVVLQAIYTDIHMHGFDQFWLALRIGIIPVGLIALYFSRFEFFKQNPSVPVLFVAFYVAAIHLYFVSQTGYADSKYFHSYIQILMGLAILPFSRRTYFLSTGLIIGSYAYLILSHAKYDWAVFTQSNVIFLKTYVLINFATFILIDRVRTKFYRKEIELEDEVEDRQKLIDAKVLELSQANSELVRRDEEALRYKALGELAAHVAHNVRSPAGTIDVIVNSIPELPMSAKLPLLSAVSQIREIANKLLRSEPHELEKRANMFRAVSVKTLLENVVSEKRLLLSRYDGVQMITNTQNMPSIGWVAKVDPTDFSSAITNLIHNAFESLHGSGTIEVNLVNREVEIVISVKDNGHGMPDYILKSIMAGQRGITHGKANGFGHGLHHAKTSVEAWGGRINITSTQGVGTTVELIIPNAHGGFGLDALLPHFEAKAKGAPDTQIA